MDDFCLRGSVRNLRNIFCSFLGNLVFLLPACCLPHSEAVLLFQNVNSPQVIIFIIAVRNLFFKLKRNDFATLNVNFANVSIIAVEYELL